MLTFAPFEFDLKKNNLKVKKKKDNKRNVLKSFKAAKKRPCEKQIALGNNDKETFTEFPLLFSFFKKYLIKM